MSLHSSLVSRTALVAWASLAACVLSSLALASPPFRLTPTDATEFEQLGRSVAISGDTAIVGVPLSNGPAGTDQGATYVFRWSGAGWTQEAKFTASDAGMDDGLGFSVAIDGDTAIVGAFRDSGPIGLDVGSVYVFSRTGTTWTQQAKLTASDAALFDQLGHAVSIDGETAIVGAYLDDDAGGADQGSAWFFNVGEESFLPLVHNTTTDTLYNSLSAGMNAALSTQFINASAPSFFETTPTDYLTKALSISSTSRLRQPYHNTITLANGASLNAATGQDMILFGGLSVPQGSDSTLRAGSLRLEPAGDITVRANASLTIDSASSQFRGDVLALPGSSMTFAGAVSASGQVTMLAGTLASPSMTISNGGRFVGDGNLVTSVTNSNEFITVNSTLITGDLTNNAGAKVTVQIGTLTLLGSLTNNGIILGDLQTLLVRGGATLPGDGFSVGGHYTAGPNASLFMSSALWRVRVGGNYDVAINDNTKYDMSLAELNLTGALPSTLELMSTDVGNSPDGLDRTLAGHFPVGTLRLGGSITSLVDVRDNDQLGQSASEALYVSNLIIDAGATLNTNGNFVYYETLTNNGVIDNPLSLIQIIACVADLNGDGQVGGADLGLLLGSWNNAGSADLNGDGTTNGADLGLLLGAWGACV